MCGIFGSINVSKFEVLDQANKIRGNFASGIFYTDGKTFDFQKTEGSFNWNKIKLPAESDAKLPYIYLGHNQAPTSSERIWKEHNSHPFVNNNWVVAHNGVLTNFEELKKEYIPDHPNVVDSSIIPALLCHFEKKISAVQECDIVKAVLPLLKGTYGLWIVNTTTLNIYLARQGSTLFYDTNSFSSLKGEGYKEIKEGHLYNFSGNACGIVGTYDSKSPFFTL